MGVPGCRKLDASSISLFFPNISINGEKTVKAMGVTMVLWWRGYFCWEPLGVGTSLGVAMATINHDQIGL